MKKLFSALLLIAILFTFYACPLGYKTKDYPNAFFPDTVSNLEKVNSIYDDINMAYWVKSSTNFIIFSSNRYSKGNHFDLVGEIVSFSWNEYDGNFYLDENRKEGFNLLPNLINETKTTFDEFGPYSVMYNNKMYLFYANNQEGTNDVYYFVYNNPEKYYENMIADSLINGPYNIKQLSNPNFNEGYISFHTSTTPFDEYNRYTEETKFINLIYSCDSLGQMDIYSLGLQQENQKVEFLPDLIKNEKEYLTSINSEFNDRCPNVCGNFMVFSSDRPGGLGGYDFYYSIYENDQWSEPVNFGAPINSAYDEYRAIAIKSYEYENDLLIFSSDRPGGLGGFDIYYIGIDVMPEANYFN